MVQIQRTRWRKELLASVAIAVMPLVLTAPGYAQDASEASQTVTVDIPAGALGDVLLAISDVFGVNIVASERVVADKSAPAVSGSLSAARALAIALSETDLVAERQSAGGFVIVLPEETAATAATQDDGVDDVIIVTGTKQNRSVQETTSSVEIFDAERLKEEALFTLNEALSRSPNTSVIGNNIDGISIRGINRNGTNGAGQGEAINIFVDGAPISSLGLEGINSLWDTQQVEVLRGSQSTVQGRNAIGGAVIVESRKPTYDWEGAVRLRIADFGTRQYSGVISGPIIEDELAFRVSADYQESDGSITDGFSGADDNFQEALTLRTRALIEPSQVEDLSVLLTFEYSDRAIGRLTPIAIAPSPEFTIDGLAVDPDFFENFDPDNRITFPLTPVSRENRTFKVISDITYDFSDQISLKLLGTVEDTTSLENNVRREASQFGLVGQVTDSDNITYQGELRLDFKFEKLSGLIGAYYFNFQSDAVADFSGLIGTSLPGFVIRPADSLVLTSTIFEQEVENYAFFTSWRYEPNDKWDIDFSFRYDNERFSTFRDDSDASIVPDNCEGDLPGRFLGFPDSVTLTLPCTVGLGIFLPEPQPLQSNNFDVFLPSGAVTYNFTEDLSVFAGVRRGYRAGGTFLASALGGADPFRVVAFGPEFLLSYEAGWRSQWFDKKLTFNGTAFFSDYNDQQVQFVDGDGFSNIVNAGETSLYGLELSADYKVTDDWDVYTSVGLLESNVDEFLFSDELDLEGNDLSRSPAVSFTIGTSYEHSSGVFGSVSLNYQAPYESDIFNLRPADLGPELTERTEATTLVNARVGYEVGPFTLTAFVTNLLDDNDPELINIGASAALTDPGTLNRVSSFTLRQPRSFGVSIDASF
ncbi:MAG: TonB-dependent receptor [Pseudomonadota bacterium]